MRKVMRQLGLVLVLGVAAACGPAQPKAGEAGQTQPAPVLQASATSAVEGAAPGAATPGVLTALPGLPTATLWRGPAGTAAATRLPVIAGEGQVGQPTNLPAAAGPTRPADPVLASTQPAPSLPTPTLDCEDGLWYVADLTIPDGTLVSPGDTIDKRWQVENSGSCNWNEGYRMRRISGEALGVPGELALYPARSGTRAVIQILFTAPAEPGTYRSAWQAYNPQGEAFGDPVFVEIIVGSGI